MKLLHFHTPSILASTPPERERNMVCKGAESAAKAAATRPALSASEWTIVNSGGSESNRVFAGIVLVAIAPRPFSAREVILKYGLGGAGGVGVIAIEGWRQV